MFNSFKSHHASHCFTFSLLVMLLIIPKIVFADTNVSGLISVNTTWTFTASPYVVKGNVLVENGIVLAIEPGVTIFFEPGKAMQINGTLIGRGTSQNPIIFSSLNSSTTSGDWAYIFFADSSIDATFDGNGQYMGGSILEYCNITSGGAGDKGSIYINKSSPYIANNSITKSHSSGIYVDRGWPKIFYNKIQDNKTYGIWLYNESYNNIYIHENEINNNQGGGIFFTELYARIISIVNNSITNNSGEGGISMERGGGSGSAQFVIQNNIISNNSGGYSGGIYIYGNHSNISNNIIVNNAASSSNPYWIYQNSGGAIYIDGGYNPFNFIISNNIISDNDAPDSGGICLFYIHGYIGDVKISNNTISRNRSSKELTAVNRLYADVGNSYSFKNNTVTMNNGYSSLDVNKYSIINTNNIFNNTITYELINTGEVSDPPINAQNNWWGENDTSYISMHVLDWFDDSTKGAVYISDNMNQISIDAPISPPTGLSIDNTNHMLSWNPNPENDIAGYRIYWGTVPGYSYQNVVDVGNVTEYSLNNFMTGTFYVTVTAYDSSYNISNDDNQTITNENQTMGHESWYAAEYQSRADSNENTSHKSKDMPWLQLLLED